MVETAYIQAMLKAIETKTPFKGEVRERSIPQLAIKEDIEVNPSHRPSFACYLPGKPPSVFRSHNRDVWVVNWPSCDTACGSDGEPAWTISIVKTPPVDGTKETSPRDVENVDRSSCANWIGLSLR